MVIKIRLEVQDGLKVCVNDLVNSVYCMSFVSSIVLQWGVVCEITKICSVNYKGGKICLCSLFVNKS